MSKKSETSPCQGCQRTWLPEQCDKKCCPVWQMWFVKSWDRMRQMFLKEDGRQEK